MDIQLLSWISSTQEILEMSENTTTADPAEYLEALKLEEQLRKEARRLITDSPHFDEIRTKIRSLYLSVALREDICHIPSKSKAAIYIAYFLGGARDSNLHRKLLDEAADAGDAVALSMRAENYWFGENTYEQNFSLCERDAIKSHLGGSWSGSTVYAWILKKKFAETGEVGLLDHANQLLTESYFRIKKEAIEGDSIAQDWLAWRYANGEGVAQDEEAGAAWFRISADNGLVWAMHWLGSRYLTGQGVIQDEEAARFWLSKAAARGLTDSQQLLQSIASS